MTAKTVNLQRLEMNALEICTDLDDVPAAIAGPLARAQAAARMLSDALADAIEARNDGNQCAAA